MYTALTVANFVAALASIVAATLALFHPASLSKSKQIDLAELFYVRMYAARSIPFGIVVGLLPFWFHGSPTAAVVFAAAAVQGADVAIAAKTKDRPMMFGATVGAIVHLSCGFTIL